MSMLDNLKNKAKDMLENPENREKIEQFARDKGISIDDAKKRFMNKDNQSQ